MRGVLPRNWMFCFSIIDLYAAGGFHISLLFKESANLFQGFLTNREILKLLRQFCKELQSCSFGLILTAAMLDGEKILKAFKTSYQTRVSEQSCQDEFAF